MKPKKNPIVDAEDLKSRTVYVLSGLVLVTAFILCLILCWNEYFLAALITSTDAKTMPVMVASQISSQSIKWWNMAAISAASCLPLIIAAIFLETHQDPDNAPSDGPNIKEWQREQLRVNYLIFS